MRPERDPGRRDEGMKRQWGYEASRSAPVSAGILACPRCGSEKLESQNKIYCCVFCSWAWDEWTIMTISKLCGQVKDLEEHIMELAEEAVERLSQKAVIETPVPPVLKRRGRGSKDRSNLSQEPRPC